LKGLWFINLIFSKVKEWVDQQGYDEFLSDPLSIANKELIIAHNQEVGVMLIEMGSDV
jgi:hypothetical protein